MAYDTFDFGYHVPVWNYPKGDAFKFGKGYTFTVEPQLPLQRTIILHFDSGLQWFFNQSGTVDLTYEPTRNMGRFEAFYAAHLTHKTFIYPHPLWGDTKVKFDADNPLQLPKTKPGGSGLTESFQTYLIEQST